MRRYFLNTFSEYSEAYARLLAGIAGDYGIAIHSVHPHGVQFEPQMFYGYERTANDAFGMFERVLAAGQALGAKPTFFTVACFISRWCSISTILSALAAR